MFFSLSQQREALFLQHLMQVINCRGQDSVGRVNYLSADSKTYTFLTSVHNNANDADSTDDADNCNRVIGIPQLKAFSCAKKGNPQVPSEEMHARFFVWGRCDILERSIGQLIIFTLVY